MLKLIASLLIPIAAQASNMCVTTSYRVTDRTGRIFNNLTVCGLAVGQEFSVADGFRIHPVVVADNGCLEAVVEIDQTQNPAMFRKIQFFANQQSKASTFDVQMIPRYSDSPSTPAMCATTGK